MSEKIALRLLLVPIGLLGVFLLNFKYPVLRTVSPSVNEAAGLVSYCLPWLAAVGAFHLRGVAHRWLAGVPCVALGVLFLPFAFFSAVDLSILRSRDDVDGGFRPVSRVACGASHVVVYATNGGATTDYGMEARHERYLGLGLVLVRSLYVAYHADPDGGAVESLGPCVVRIRHIHSSQSVGDFALRPWVYF